jgi:putative hydrolase of the HAD superfamily
MLPVRENFVMLVLFDIDDTLLDHLTASNAGAIALHRRLGIGLPVEQFLSTWSAALDRHYERYLAGEISFSEQRRARMREAIDSSLSDEASDRAFDGYLAAYEDSWSLFPDVLPCLDRLSDCRLGIISNGQGVQQRRKLARTGIAHRFMPIVISDECGWTKPSAEIFLHACQLAGESPHNTIYVGDRYDVDAAAARRAGLTGIWLDRRSTRTKLHQSPIIGTLDELLIPSMDTL